MRTKSGSGICQGLTKDDRRCRNKARAGELTCGRCKGGAIIVPVSDASDEAAKRAVAAAVEETQTSPFAAAATNSLMLLAIEGEDDPAATANALAEDADRLRPTIDEFDLGFLMIEHRDLGVRKRAIAHPMAPIDVVQQIADDENVDGGERAAARRLTPDPSNQSTSGESSPRPSGTLGNVVVASLPKRAQIGVESLTMVASDSANRLLAAAEYAECSPQDLGTEHDDWSALHAEALALRSLAADATPHPVEVVAQVLNIDASDAQRLCDSESVSVDTLTKIARYPGSHTAPPTSNEPPIERATRAAKRLLERSPSAPKSEATTAFHRGHPRWAELRGAIQDIYEDAQQTQLLSPISAVAAVLGVEFEHARSLITIGGQIPDDALRSIARNNTQTPTV